MRIKWKKFKSQEGIALIISLITVLVMTTLGSVLVVRTVGEKMSSDQENFLVHAFYISEAGAEAALSKLNELINSDLLITVNTKNPQLVGNRAQQYASQDKGLDFLEEFVQRQNANQFAFVEGDDIVTYGADTIKYEEPWTNFGLGRYRFDILVKQKDPPGPQAGDVEDSWDFPYFYRLESSSNVNGAIRKVLLTGDFTVRVQRDNFAKFALFTDHHGLPSGTPVWFTDKTNFAGPIHTNGQYNFALNPSGIFEQTVTQHLSKARFYNNGWPVQLDQDTNPPYDVPRFMSTYERGYDDIVLASSVQKQDLYDQATGGDDIVGNGIFVPNDGANITGGIFVRGDASVTMGVNGSDNAQYTIVEGGTTKIVTVDIPNNQTSIETVGGGTETYTGKPDGVDDLGTIVYVDGSVSALSGTVQSDTEVTVSSENNITISDDIVYSNYTSAVGSPGDVGYVPPNAEGTTNLMGIVSWGGDVRIGTTAPDDVNIHSVIMARNGVFQVDDYDDSGVGSRGTATLLGGAITQFYGAFGQFNGATGQQISGFGRNFVYDSRTLYGKAPPYFPSMKTFIAFTNDITDKIAWQEGGF